MTPQELKNSILQMAIQGKLVEQRPEEGTGEELYQQIQAEKQRLIAEKKIKKDKPLPKITDDEKPFDIPDSWKWVRIIDVATLYNGRAYKQAELLDKGKYPVLRVGNLFTSDKWYYSDMELEETKYCDDGDLLYSWSASFGPHIWNRGKAIYHYHIWKVEYSPVVNKKYLYYFLLADTVQIKKSGHGLAMIHVTKEGTEKRGMPLPPLAEQKRIVAKIEELLPLIDRYEAAWSRLEAFNKRFPEDMQKSILQEAIQGKLVEQRPEEGTGEELYQQIQAEKQRLIAEKKIKKNKPLPEITDDEKPFDIPDSWKWVRLGALLQYIDTGKSFKCNEVPPLDDQCGIVKVSAVSWGTFKEDESKTCFSNDSWGEQYAIHEKDFLISRANTAALVGSCVIVNQVKKKLMLSDKILRLHFSKLIHPFYLLWVLRSPLVRSQFSIAATGTSESMKNISQDTIRNTIISLPPLAEQERIVAKIEQLLPLCERLK